MQYTYVDGKVTLKRKWKIYLHEHIPHHLWLGGDAFLSRDILARDASEYHDPIKYMRSWRVDLRVIGSGAGIDSFGHVFG